MSDLLPVPVIILVEPQLGENIGMAARAMGNFGLGRLRLVAPRDGWPNLQAQRAAAGADHILAAVELFDTVDAAIADLDFLLATTARAHDQAKPVIGPEAAAREMAAEIGGGGKVGILFGRERIGLLAEEVARADRIVTFPVDPQFASLNLAQAVLLVGYEWFRTVRLGALPHGSATRSPRAGKDQITVFFDNLVRELDRAEFLRPPEKRDTMLVNLRNIFARMEPTRQDIQTLHGVVTALVEGRKGSARGGVLDAEGAGHLRVLLSDQIAVRPGDPGGSVRGVARLLRRNPTEAERLLWDGLRADRRLAGQFKRQTPVGRTIPDFVSFPHRIAIELVPEGETGEAARNRLERRTWLEQRSYRVMTIASAEVERDRPGVLDQVAAAVAASPPA